RVGRGGPEVGGASPRPLRTLEVVDRFIERYNAQDAKGLLTLTLVGATAENVGNSVHVGADSAQGTPRFLHSVLHGHREWPLEFQRESKRIERVEFEGEPIVLAFATYKGREALESA